MNTLTLVQSKEDVDKIRPYKEHYDLRVYPKRYPAFVGFKNHEGGIVGDYYTMKMLEIPENVCALSFIEGVLNKPKKYTENIFKRKTES